METQVRTPQMVFMQPQRLIVPLFQRPYVWNEENQWAPLWGDLTRLAERLLKAPQGKHHPHFLGAVVLQQVQNPVGAMQERMIIDGQQRLTTLQLLLDALHGELLTAGAIPQAMRIEPLVTNAHPFWERPADQFKVLPTNRDRAAFNEVMGAANPVTYTSLMNHGARLVEAHRFFAKEAKEWLNANGDEDVDTRAAAIERTVRELLQLVVIDLTLDENAQEIFETLNARGAQLTAADLIKNFVFQRLIESGVDVEAAYETNWKEFETGFWETEMRFGRFSYSRSSIFLDQWLIARTGEDIVAREVFARFKSYADHEAGVPMVELLQQIRRAAFVYRSFVEQAGNLTEPVDRLGLFAYRTNTMESEVFKPLILWLLDPELDPLSGDKIRRSLEVVESWLARRMLVRASTKGYNQVATELIAQLNKSEREDAPAVIENFFRYQTAPGRYWPDDGEVRSEIASLMAYRRLRRGRLRMVLEAIEDHRRGWKGTSEGFGGQRVVRGKYTIEHIMPRKWNAHWPLTTGVQSEAERDQLLHTLGNLTLLTTPLNTKVANGPWSTKRLALQEHDVLKLNSDLLDDAQEEWTDERIRHRTKSLIQSVLEIWPVPKGHKSGFSAQPSRKFTHKVEVADLIGAGLLEAGATLYVRRQKHAHRTATVLSDGRIDVDGVPFARPSGAAAAITGKTENGWWLFLVEPGGKRSLRDIAHDYVDQTSADVDEADLSDDEDG